MPERVLVDLEGGFTEDLGGQGPLVIERASARGGTWPATLPKVRSAAVLNLFELGRTQGASIVVEAVGAQTVVEGPGLLCRLPHAAVTLDRLARTFGLTSVILTPGVAAETDEDGLTITGIGDRATPEELLGAAVCDLAFSLASHTRDMPGPIAVIGLSFWIETCAAVLAGVRDEQVYAVSATEHRSVLVAPFAQRRTLAAMQAEWQRLRTRRRA